MVNETTNVFIGIGAMTLLFVLAYMFYQLTRGFKFVADVEEKYSILEELGLDKTAKKKGIDLNKEIMKRRILNTRTKSFRRRIED